MRQPSVASSVSPVHLRDVHDKAGKLQPVPAPAKRQFSLLLLLLMVVVVVVVVVIVIVVIITNNFVITIILITIIRTAATQGAGLARWRDLPQAAGILN